MKNKSIKLKENVSFTLFMQTIIDIKALSEAEMGGNKSKWLQRELDAIIAARKSENKFPKS